MTLPQLNTLIARGEKIAMLTCYDATYAKLMEAEGVDVLLVGDSLGMVLQGSSDTLAVTMQDDGTKPSRLAWTMKERILPPVYWQAMLKGREWMARPKVMA